LFCLGRGGVFGFVGLVGECCPLAFAFDEVLFSFLQMVHPQTAPSSFFLFWRLWLPVSVPSLLPQFTALSGPLFRLGLPARTPLFLKRFCAGFLSPPSLRFFRSLLSRIGCDCAVLLPDASALPPRLRTLFHLFYRTPFCFSIHVHFPLFLIWTNVPGSRQSRQGGSFPPEPDLDGPRTFSFFFLLRPPFSFVFFFPLFCCPVCFALEAGEYFFSIIPGACGVPSFFSFGFAEM